MCKKRLFPNAPILGRKEKQMSDYIKRDDAIKAVANNYWHGTDCECYAFAHKALDGIQSADVVQVIRCKDCKYYDTPKNFKKPYCMRGAYVKVNADDYCSKGERK